MTFDGTCERGGFQRAPQETGEIPPGFLDSRRRRTRLSHEALPTHTKPGCSFTGGEGGLPRGGSFCFSLF
jgi:hypothetical protein